MNRFLRRARRGEPAQPAPAAPGTALVLWTPPPAFVADALSARIMAALVRTRRRAALGLLAPVFGVPLLVAAAAGLLALAAR